MNIKWEENQTFYTKIISKYVFGDLLIFPYWFMDYIWHRQLAIVRHCRKRGICYDSATWEMAKISSSAIKEIPVCIVSVQQSGMQGLCTQPWLSWVQPGGATLWARQWEQPGCQAALLGVCCIWDLGYSLCLGLCSANKPTHSEPSGESLKGQVTFSL